MTEFYHARRMILAGLPDDLLDVIESFLSGWEMYL